MGDTGPKCHGERGVKEKKQKQKKQKTKNKKQKTKNKKKNSARHMGAEHGDRAAPLRTRT
jgi:hypothetical protein